MTAKAGPVPGSRRTNPPVRSGSLTLGTGPQPARPSVSERVGLLSSGGSTRPAPSSVSYRAEAWASRPSTARSPGRPRGKASTLLRGHLADLQRAVLDLALHVCEPQPALLGCAF